MRWLIAALFLALAVRAEADSNGWVEQYPELCKPSLVSHTPQVVRVRTVSPRKVTERGKSITVFDYQYCSGVVVGSTQVLTAFHCMTTNGTTVVIAGDAEYLVAFHTPSTTADLTLLEVVSPMDIPPVEIATEIPIALMLVGYGCSGYADPVQRSAVMLFTTDDQIGIGGCVCHGDSGGAVFDDYGQLLGIMVSTYEDGKHGKAARAEPFMRSLHLIDGF